MGFYSTTLEQEKPHQKTSDCAQKTASGKFFTSNRNRTYQIDRNPLETQQEKLTTTTETASGVFFYKYRHYSAELGRWLGRDPIEQRGGVNLYVFVGNHPVGLWDWLGLCAPRFECMCGEKKLVKRKTCLDDEIVKIDQSRTIGITVGHGTQLPAEEDQPNPRLQNFLENDIYDFMSCVTCWQ